MIKFPWSSKGEQESFKPLNGNAGFVLDIEGHKVIALKLSAKIAKEIAGKKSTGSEGMLSKLKGKFTHSSEYEQWLAVTNIDNPLLEEYDLFGALVVQELTNATGSSVPISKLAISASVPITRMEAPELLTVGDQDGRHDPPTIDA